MIYLDHNATTPTDPRIVKVMLPYFTELFANSASDHALGSRSKQGVDSARKAVADLLHAREDEIVFTSGATESNNIAILGCVDKLATLGKRHIITSAIEHPAVLEPLKYLEGRGWRITFLKPDSSGKITPSSIESSITAETGLVSIMFANNEIGTIQDIGAIGKVTRARGIFFHTDAAQAVGHLPIDVDKLNIDLLSLSAHKFYGPKGVGALFVRSRLPRVKVSPITYGGGQERGMRSGTLNVPLIVGLGLAASLAQKEMKKRHTLMLSLMSYLKGGICREFPEASVNGHPLDRLAHNLSVTLPGIDNKWLMLRMKEFCFSTGSACSAFHDVPSHVLLAIGLTEDQVANTIRLGLGTSSTKAHVDAFVAELAGLKKECSVGPAR